MELRFSADDALSHAVAEVIDGERVRAALNQGSALHVKLGIDPTSPDIHLGRSIPLWRLRAFQELGAVIHLIVGDFTGEVGDTSDKDAERPMLSREQVEANMARYEEQLWMVLNPERRDQVHIHYNSEWLSGLTLGELTRLADAFSVNTFVKRELISRRLDAGSRVSLREMLYPLMQGYDSLKVHASVELGGTDQRFNLLAGRTLQEQAGLEPQAIIMNPLIPGTDGRKMSSSWGNVIRLLDTPSDKFGKTMTIRDEDMASYLLVLPRSAWPFTAEELTERMGHENPRDLKLMLAERIVALYHGEEEGMRMREAFMRQFSEGQKPEEMGTLLLHEAVSIVDAVVMAGFAPSKSEARRLVEQGGVRVNDVVIHDMNALIEPADAVLQVGKRNFARVAHA